jgi:hypothetical protein
VNANSESNHNESHLVLTLYSSVVTVCPTALNIVNQLFFITVKCRAFFAVGAEFSTIIQVSFGFRRLKDHTECFLDSSWCL